jgi:hypothetical protein
MNKQVVVAMVIHRSMDQSVLLRSNSSSCLMRGAALFTVDPGLAWVPHAALLLLAALLWRRAERE